LTAAERADEPRLALVGFRSDENSSFLRGAAEAPPLIRSALASDSSNAWCENGRELTGSTFHDAGDFAAPPGATMLATIEAAIGALLDRGLRPISLGGDHAITYPILRAFAKRQPRLSILHFDAHPDLYDEFQGNRLSHACPFARIMEEGLARRLVQVVEMKDFRDGIEVAFDGPVYVSIDLDGLDPAFAPGVSHREPGGLSTRQTLDVIAGVRAPVVGADVVEFNPRMDPTGMTAMVCAKLVKELAGKMLETT
jgi:agmatinase